MSKERELLERSLYFLEPSDWEEDSDTSRTCIKLSREIQQLLTQPELIDLDQVDKHLEICDLSEDYRDGYSDGIIFAEREHGVRGQNE